MKDQTSPTWAPDIEELKTRTTLASRMGGPEGLSKQEKSGRLNVRQRINTLLDQDTWHETGAIAGLASYDEEGNLTDIQPSNFLLGTGRVNGRRVVIGADDFTIRGGAADAAVGQKAPYAERMALDLRLPMIRLVEGTGGGGSVKFLEKMSSTYVPFNPALDVMVELNSTVPVVGAALGPVAGLGAARVVFSHFSVMVKEKSQVFVAGPPVVEPAIGRPISKEELGGHLIHGAASGVIDNVADSEEQAFEHIRRFLSYMPDSVYEAPPVTAATDPADRAEEELLDIVPRQRRRTYNMRRILELVLDRESFFEIGKKQARSVITGLARISGKPVGVIANDPRFLGGAVDAMAAEKMTRFIDMCDTFHLPVVNFVDNPGFLIGPEGEKAGTIRHGARWMHAVYQATVPWCSILVRRVFGVAGATHGNHTRLNLRYAWPSGYWGSLPIEGGVQAAYKRVIEAADDPEKLRRELEERLAKVMSPFRTAEMFHVEEIIDPRNTRPMLCEWIETAWRLLPSMLGPKKRGLRP